MLALLLAVFTATPATWPVLDLRPGDVVNLSSGSYGSATFGQPQSGVAYLGPEDRSAVFSDLYVSPDGRDVGLMHLTVTGSHYDGVVVEGTAALADLYVHDSRGAGIKFKNGGTGTVEGCDVRRNGVTQKAPGIVAQNQASVAVGSTNVQDNGDYGVLCWGCVDSDFHDNTIHHNGTYIDWAHGGSEIGVGGYQSDGGNPARVHVLRNSARDSVQFYGVYVLCSCDDVQQGGPVEVAFNTMSGNNSGPMAVARCDRMPYSIHSNQPNDFTIQRCKK